MTLFGGAESRVPRARFISRWSLTGWPDRAGRREKALPRRASGPCGSARCLSSTKFGRVSARATSRVIQHAEVRPRRPIALLLRLPPDDTRQSRPRHVAPGRALLHGQSGTIYRRALSVLGTCSPGYLGHDAGPTLGRRLLRTLSQRTTATTPPCTWPEQAGWLEEAGSGTSNCSPEGILPRTTRTLLL